MFSHWLCATFYNINGSNLSHSQTSAGIFCRMLNAEQQMLNAKGNRVNQVSGLFSQYNDPKRNLIHSVS